MWATMEQNERISQIRPMQGWQSEEKLVKHCAITACNPDEKENSIRL